MTNEERIEIGRKLLALYNDIAFEGGVSETTIRDSVCDVLHAAITDGLIKEDELDEVATECVGHVRFELEEQCG